jgi:GTP cyclohydrolase I
MRNNPVRIAKQTEPEISPDAQLVRNALLENGLETPMIENGLSNEQKYERIRGLMNDVVRTLGLDLNDDSLTQTPHRIAKMYVSEIFSGLDYSQFPKLILLENKMGSDEMIRVDGIELTSTCEHHFITIDGKTSVAYVPDEKIIGLSKINRIVRFFSQRPQVQERLTNQILIAMQTLLDTKDVAVRIDAIHYCVKSRGVMDGSSQTTTKAFGGCFKADSEKRLEFLAT